MAVQFNDPTRSSNFHSQILQFSRAIVESNETGEEEDRRSETRSTGMSPSGLISQTNADDWMLACRKMDRSLWITDYPLAFLPLRPAALLLRQLATAVSNCPLPPQRRLASSFSCSTSLSRRLSTFASRIRTETKKERERGEKGPFELAVPAICHMPTFAASPFSSSKRSPRQRQPNPPRNSDAISMNGDVQALIRYGGYSKARRILSYEAMNFTVILGL